MHGLVGGHEARAADAGGATISAGASRRGVDERAQLGEERVGDEAMAGLSHSEVSDIVALLIRLNERGITVILIEHIMRAVMSFSQRLVVLVSGRKIADGRPEEVIRDPEVERAYLGQ